MAKKKTTSARKKTATQKAAKKPAKKTAKKAAKKTAKKPASRSSTTSLDSRETVDDYSMDNLSDSYESSYDGATAAYGTQEDEKEGSTFRLLALGIVILVLLGLIYYTFFTGSKEKPAVADSSSVENITTPPVDKPAEKALEKVEKKAEAAVKPAEKSELGVAPAAKTEKPAAAPGGRTYTVKAGDTLSKIAAAQMGNAGRWNEIKKLNQLESNSLRVGQVLKLPE